jgi:hypothetical protein
MMGGIELEQHPIVESFQVLLGEFSLEIGVINEIQQLT